MKENKTNLKTFKESKKYLESLEVDVKLEMTYGKKVIDEIKDLLNIQNNN